MPENENASGSDDIHSEQSQESPHVSRARLLISIGIGALVFVLAVVALVVIAVYRVNEHSARIKFGVESFFSLLVLAVVIIQASIYYRQAKALDAQLKISDDTFKLLERPSLGIISVEVLPTKDNEGHAIKVTIQNTGHLPARAVTVRTSGAQGNAGTVESCADLWPIEPPRGGILSKGTVPVNALFLSFAYPPITNAEFEPIENGRTWLYAYSRVDYGADGKTQPYFTEYYGRYSPLTGQFDVCDTHNDAN